MVAQVATLQATIDRISVAVGKNNRAVKTVLIGRGRVVDKEVLKMLFGNIDRSSW